MELKNKIKMTCDVITKEGEGQHTITLENAYGDVMIEVLAMVDYENDTYYYTGAFEIINTIFDKEHTLRIINDCINDSNVDLFIDRDEAIDLIITNKYYDIHEKNIKNYLVEDYSAEDDSTFYTSIYELNNNGLEKIINCDLE
jgi:flagellar basal body rod protein FlgG